jgi:galactokinase
VIDTGRLVAAFAERTDSAPDGVWAAPGRVNLIGEHTDYNDGFVLPIAIDRHVVAAARRRDDDRFRCWSLQEDEAADARLTELRPEHLEGWSAYPLGVAWALKAAGLVERGADVVVDSDLQRGSGLSSSAALECSVALALSDLQGNETDRTALARAGQRAETEVVGVPTGIMDQLASMHGRAAHALFIDTRSLGVEAVPLDLAVDGLTLAVVDTRAPRRLRDGGYAERRAACEAAARALGVRALRDVSEAQVEQAAAALGDPGARRARHVVTENARVLAAVDALRARDYRAVGELLDASHDSLRDDFEVSTPELDAAAAACRAAGAFGARMTGGGFGGCAIALVADERVGELERQVAAAFGAAGWAPPDVFVVAAADGARRIA